MSDCEDASGHNSEQYNEKMERARERGKAIGPVCLHLSGFSGNITGHKVNSVVLVFTRVGERPLKHCYESRVHEMDRETMHMDQ